MFKSKKYDDETLKHLQKVQLMMLKDFVKRFYQDLRG